MNAATDLVKLGIEMPQRADKAETGADQVRLLARLIPSSLPVSMEELLQTDTEYDPEAGRRNSWP